MIKYLLVKSDAATGLFFHLDKRQNSHAPLTFDGNSFIPTTQRQRLPDSCDKLALTSPPQAL